MDNLVVSRVGSRPGNRLPNQPYSRQDSLHPNHLVPALNRPVSHLLNLVGNLQLSRRDNLVDNLRPNLQDNRLGSRPGALVDNLPASPVVNPHGSRPANQQLSLPYSRRENPLMLQRHSHRLFPPANLVLSQHLTQRVNQVGNLLASPPDNHLVSQLDSLPGSLRDNLHDNLLDSHLDNRPVNQLDNRQGSLPCNLPVSHHNNLQDNLQLYHR